jgi:putative ABC transport system permease protein
LFSLTPAISLSRTRVHEALKEGGRSTGGAGDGTRVRAVLVVVEVALALLLSIGASLMLRTLYELSTANPGFRVDGLLTASIDLPRTRYPARERILAFYDDVLGRVRSLPGVRSVCLTNSLPLGGNYFRGDFPIQGREYRNPADVPILNLRGVDRGYLDTFGIALLRGRFFEERDRNGPPVAVINETTARRYWGVGDPLGARVGYQGWRTIIGVVADVKHTDVSLGPDSEVLMPLEQIPSPGVTLVVRADPAQYREPEQLAPLIRRAVAAADGKQAVYRVESMAQIASDRLGPRRLNMVLLVLFAVLALLLSGVGIYGVLSFAVQRRTHEIGVRLALGAETRDVLRIVIRQALALVSIGLIFGAAAAAGLARLLSTLLYGVTPRDPWMFAGSALVLAGVGLLAAWLPARRAAQVDPLVALRYD